ncbi:hypothetical protein [Neorhodopirellula lusitana]|uniref:hypothetical protein n=1 Tax=Neorhodopirellula lusitana TaxID=445327 RepID=UPI003850B390
MTTTLATRKQSEAIRDRMQAIRNELPYDADAARARVQELTDWKYHMRKHPWPLLAAAAVAGYLLVPSKQPVRVTHDSDRPSSQPPADAPKKSMLGGVVGALATLAIKQGTTIATRKLSDAFLSAATSPSVGRPAATRHDVEPTTDFHQTEA